MSLVIENLHANVEGTEILKGLSLTIPKGEVHAICLLYTSDAAAKA